MKDLEPNKWRYYGPFEVVVHNSPRDCWVSFLGKVYNITPLITIYSRDPCIKPLLAMAGKDISHWFDEKAGDIQHYIHPVTGNFVPYLPYGKIPDIEPQVPDTRWRPEHNPWWKNDLYQIGLLTKRARPLRIINMLTCKEVQINVCCEDTLIRIAERYSIFNKDTDSYLWRYDGKVVNMYKTLEENGILDERDRFCELGIPANFYIPAILLYFTDDFNHLEDDLDDEDECEIFQKSITVDLTPKEISAPDYLSTIDMEVAEEGYKDDDNDLLYFRQAIMDLPPIHTNVIRELLQSTTTDKQPEIPAEIVTTYLQEIEEIPKTEPSEHEEELTEKTVDQTEYSGVATQDQSEAEAEEKTDVEEENATETIDEPSAVPEPSAVSEPSAVPEEVVSEPAATVVEAEVTVEAPIEEALAASEAEAPAASEAEAPAASEDEAPPQAEVPLEAEEHDEAIAESPEEVV